MRAKNLWRAMAAATLSTPFAAASAADWMQFGYDATHSGRNPVETTLSAANVD